MTTYYTKDQAEMIEKWERLEKDYAEWVGEGEEELDDNE